MALTHRNTIHDQVKAKPDMLPQSKKKSSKKRTSRGLVEIETDLCKGCLLCMDACPTDVLRTSAVMNKMGYHPAEYIGEGCTGCGVCFYVCPEPGAIRVYKCITTREVTES